MKQRDFDFTHDTLLNGAAVTITLAVRNEWLEDDPSITLTAVWFEDTNILPVLDQATLNALEMDGLSALYESGRE